MCAQRQAILRVDPAGRNVISIRKRFVGSGQGGKIKSETTNHSTYPALVTRIISMWKGSAEHVEDRYSSLNTAVWIGQLPHLAKACGIAFPGERHGATAMEQRSRGQRLSPGLSERGRMTPKSNYGSFGEGLAVKG